MVTQTVNPYADLLRAARHDQRGAGQIGPGVTITGTQKRFLTTAARDLNVSQSEIVRRCLDLGLRLAAEFGPEALP